MENSSESSNNSLARPTLNTLKESNNKVMSYSQFQNIQHQQQQLRQGHNSLNHYSSSTKSNSIASRAIPEQDQEQNKKPSRFSNNNNTNNSQNSNQYYYYNQCNSSTVIRPTSESHQSILSEPYQQQKTNQEKYQKQAGISSQALRITASVSQRTNKPIQQVSIIDNNNKKSFENRQKEQETQQYQQQLNSRTNKTGQCLSPPSHSEQPEQVRHKLSALLLDQNNKDTSAGQTIRSALSPPSRIVQKQLSNRQIFSVREQTQQQPTQPTSKLSNKLSGQEAESNTQTLRNNNNNCNKQLIQFTSAYASNPVSSSKQDNPTIEQTPQRSNKSVTRQLSNLGDLDFEVVSHSHSAKHQQPSQYLTKNALLIKNKQNLSNNPDFKQEPQQTQQLGLINNQHNYNGSNGLQNNSRSNSNSNSNSFKTQLFNNFFQRQDRDNNNNNTNNIFAGEQTIGFECSPKSNLDQGSISSSQRAVTNTQNNLNISRNLRNTLGNNPKDHNTVNSYHNNNNCVIQRKVSLSKKGILDDVDSLIPQAGSSTADVTEKSYKNTAVNTKHFHENSIENMILLSQQSPKNGLRKITTPPNSLGRIPNCIETPQYAIVRGFSSRDVHKDDTRQLFQKKQQQFPDNQGKQLQLDEEDSQNASYLIEQNRDNSDEREGAYESDVRRRLKSKVCALKYGNESSSNNSNSQNGYLLPRSQSSLAEEHSEDSLLDAKIAGKNFTANPSKPNYLENQHGQLDMFIAVNCPHCAKETTFKVPKMHNSSSHNSGFQGNPNSLTPKSSSGGSIILQQLNSKKSTNLSSTRDEQLCESRGLSLSRESNQQVRSGSNILLLGKGRATTPSRDLASMLGRQQTEIIAYKDKILELEKIVETLAKEKQAIAMENEYNLQKATTLQVENTELLKNMTNLLAIKLKIS